MNRGVILLTVVPFILIAGVTMVVVQKGMSDSYQAVEQDALSYSMGNDATGVRRRPGLADISAEGGPFGLVVRQDVSPAPAATRARLTFILISDDQRLALINGTVVREGDHLFGQTVAAIEKTRVALTRDGVTQWIVLQN